MSDKQIWICISLWLSFIILLMIWQIRGYYKGYSKSKKFSRNSKFDLLKWALQDFFNGPANQGYASILGILFIIPFIFIGKSFAVLLPIIILKILCIISGIVFTLCFLKSVYDTMKSIKKEKLRTTIKAKWQGVLSFFIFMLFVLAYTSKIVP